jgi:hypothetical protein
MYMKAIVAWQQECSRGETKSNNMAFQRSFFYNVLFEYCKDDSYMPVTSILFKL